MTLKDYFNITLIVIILVAIVLGIIVSIHYLKKELESEIKRQKEDDDARMKLLVKIRQLSQGENNDIHSKVKIIPDEIIEEWKKYGCPPGYSMGGTGSRCQTFKDCQECLICYANEHLDYISLLKELKIVNSPFNKTWIDY